METSLPINNLKIMISKLKLNKIQEDLVQVIDKSEYDCSSLPAKFLYEDTISINYLQKLTSDSNKVKQVYISEHDNFTIMAKELNIDYDTLENTIYKYNEAFETQLDEFNKTTFFIWKETYMNIILKLKKLLK